MLRRVNGVPSIMATRRTITFLLGAALWQLIGSQTALARSGFAVDSDSLPSGGGYQIMKNTLYGGGGADSLTGGGFSARSSYGQPASGTAAGGAFEVRGGFTPTPTPTPVPTTPVPGIDPGAQVVAGLALAIAGARRVRRRAARR